MFCAILEENLTLLCVRSIGGFGVSGIEIGGFDDLLMLRVRVCYRLGLLFSDRSVNTIKV